MSVRVFRLMVAGLVLVSSFGTQAVAEEAASPSQEQRYREIGRLAYQRASQIEKAMDKEQLEALVRSAKERAEEVRKKLDPDGDGVIREEDIARYSWESRRERTKALHKRLREEGWGFEDLDRKSDEVTYEGDSRPSRKRR